MNQTLLYLAYAAAGLILVLVISVLAWAINSYDWGVALMLLAPFVVWGLIRLARALESWAGG